MRRFCALLFAVCLCLCPRLVALPPQSSDPAPTLQRLGLRSPDHHGAFAAAKTLPDGSLVLLENDADGIHLLKTDPAASQILAQTQLGAAGDVGASLAEDPAGNFYVTGTTTSGHLGGTSGAAFPAPADTTTNSFVARFDGNLTPGFVTFLGAGKTEVNDIAATADAVFVTGVTYSSTFPATDAALQTTPPNANGGNAFVERFSADGSTLVYATFLDAPGGTTPTAIAADSTDAAYIAGSTSAAAFPVAAAIQPVMSGTVSGFLTKLAPNGNGLSFSTFLAGAGLSSLVFDPATGTLLASGNLDPARFPLANILGPQAAIPYESVLRLSSDGQTLLSSLELLPGHESYAEPAPDGGFWVSGTLDLPLPPAPTSAPGDTYALHVDAAGNLDQLLRLGGTVANNPGYATLTTVLAPPAISPDGATIYVPGTTSAHTAASLLQGQSFNLPLNAAGSSVFPNNAADLLPSTCAAGQDCSGEGALLAVFKPSASTAFLTASLAGGTNLTLRNTGAGDASGLTISSSGVVTTTNCGQELAAPAQCGIVVSGSGPGSITAAASNAPSVAVTIPALPSSTPASPLMFDQAELDFGIISAAAAGTRTVTVTNLGGQPQTFVSAPQNVPTNASFALAEAGTTCAGSPAAHTLAAGASCTVTIALSASSAPSDDGPVKADWQLGNTSLPVTGYAEAASLALSTSELDFGIQVPGSTNALPRFLYLSNNSAAAVMHSPLSLPAGAPFSLLDGCPASLAPGSVCQITFNYTEANAPAFDSMTLELDGGLSVLLTGQTASGSGPSTPLPPSPLVLTPRLIVFPSAVQVTQVSAEIEAVQVTNPTNQPVPVAAAVLGDFVLENACPATLPGGASCTVNLLFAPSQAGTRGGLLTMTTGPSNQPAQVSLSGVGTPIVAANNGTLDLGETIVGEPTVSWFQVAGTFPQLTATVAGPGLSVALLADDGSGHGTLPASAFAATGSAQCTDCWIAVRHLPTSPGVTSGSLQIASSGAGSTYTLALTAAALPAQGLVLDPPAGGFGVIPVGKTSPPLTLVLTNLSGDGSSVSIQQLSSSGDFAIVPAATMPPCTRSLQADAACGIAVTFSPKATGRRTGTLQVVTASETVTATLNGTGAIAATAYAPPAGVPTPAVTIFPAAADFGAGTVGALTAIRTFTLTNTSTTPQAITLLPSRDFSFTAPPGCGSLAAGASCQIQIAFVPETAGPIAGTVILNATAQGGVSAETQTVLYLKGFGTATGSVAFSAATSPAAPLDFGTLAAGTSLTQTVTLTNTGAGNLTLRRLTSTAPFATSATCTSALAPGATCDLDVTYLAATTQSGDGTQPPRTDTGTLLIETDADGSPATLYLTGNATASPSTAAAQPVALPTYTLSASAITFPNTQPGAPSAPRTLTLTNTGSVPVTFGAFAASDGFHVTSACATLQPGASCPLIVTFQPAANTPTALLGTVSLLSNSAAAVDFVSLLGTSVPAQLQFSPGSLSFGPVPVGGSAQLTDIVTNLTNGPLTLGALLASGDFSVNYGTCGSGTAPLAGGQSCTLTITFTPSGAGVHSGTLTIPGTSGTTQSLPLTGTGTAPRLEVTPGRLDFGSVLLGSSGSQSLTIANTGNAPSGSLAYTVSGSAADEYAVTSSCPSASLPAGSSCTLTISFSPASAGSQAATLNISSLSPSVPESPAEPITVPLTGIGAQPPGILLTVGGAGVATANVNSGGIANFALLLTPQGGFNGTVSITCQAVAPAPNASCQLGNTQLGPLSGPMASSASVKTLSGIAGSTIAPLSLLSLGALRRRRRRSTNPGIRALALAVACLLVLASSLAGCGGHNGTGNPYTPPGTYQYRVTATGTTGTAALTSSVVLSVVVH